MTFHKTIILALGLIGHQAFGYGDELSEQFKVACGNQAWAQCQSLRFDLFNYNPKDEWLSKWRMTNWEDTLGVKYHMTVRVAEPMVKGDSKFQLVPKKNANIQDSKYKADNSMTNEDEAKRFADIVNDRLRERFKSTKMSYTINKYGNPKARWMERVMLAYLLQGDKKNSVIALNEIPLYLNKSVPSEQKRYQKSYAWAIKYWKSVE